MCVSKPCPGRRQSKKFILSKKRRSNNVRNRVSDCHLSPDWRQMAIENTVPIDFDPRSSFAMGVFDCHISGV